MLLPKIEALGTHWHIEVLDDSVNTEKLQTFTEDFLESFEQKYSRFRDNSDLSKLNMEGVFNDPSDEFLDILGRAESAYKDTDGVFNIAVGHKMETSGYDSDYSFTKTESVVVPVLTDVLSFTTEQITLNGGKLDLGGIGKGYLIDQLAEAYQVEFDLKYFVINGGGDIFATSDHGKAVEITLTHPRDRSLGIGSVLLLNQGFAASSPFVRAWKDRKTNTETNHLHTSNNIASYVVADNVCDADIWATTLAINPELHSESPVDCLLLQNTGILHRDNVFNLNT